MISQNTRGRMFSIDVLRVISAFYVVGFWHAMNYINGYHGYFNPYTSRLTVITLSLFTFSSGFLLGRKQIQLSTEDVFNFYRKRLVRIYPPFLLALVCFLALRAIDFTLFAKSALLLATIWGPAPPTLWYICMIAVFYLLAPFLIACRERFIPFFSTAVGIYLLLFASWPVFGVLDTRMLIYFPSFVAGIFFAGRSSLFTGRFITVMGGLTAIAILLGWGIPTEFVETSALSMPLALFAALFILALATRGDAYLSSRLISELAYATLFMYLFHRVVYRPAMYLFPSKDPNIQLAFILLVCLPIVVVFSWLGQRLYDEILKRLGLAS